jgi:hypothetical protein
MRKSFLIASDEMLILIVVYGKFSIMFFKFYGELLRKLSKPVDLVNLSHKTLFNKLVEQRGTKIYG